VPDLMDMSEADSLIYVGNTYFELYNKTKQCYLGVIVFGDRIHSVFLDEKSLSKSTTMEMVKSMFSTCDSFRQMRIYKDNRVYQTCRIPLTYNHLETGDYLILFFNDEISVRIDLWKPS
jgi:hypothetical protein